MPRLLSITAVLPLLCVAAASCGGAQKRGPTRALPTPAVCAQSGDIEGPASVIRRADRDLDGDGNAEVVAAKLAECRGGNCVWAIYRTAPGDCPRRIGAIEGADLELLDTRGEGGFRDVRAWWKFPGGERKLLTRYRFVAGTYRVTETMSCREQGDDRLLCATQTTR